MNKWICRTICVLVIFCLLMQPSMRAVEAQSVVEELVDTRTQPSIYLPLALNGLLPYGYHTFKEATDSSGEVVFHDPTANGDITVRVEEQSGAPVENASVIFMTDGNEARALVVTEDNRVGWAEGNYPTRETVSRGFTLTLIAIIIGGSLITWHYLKLSENPPRIDQELGYTRSCWTYEQFKHAMGVGLGVFSLHTAAAHGLWAFLGHTGLEKTVLEVAPMISDATGKSWPWEGEWCFRISRYHDTNWITPETDVVTGSQFRAKIYWDKDDTDVDLHVYDTFGNHAYFGNKDGIPGGYLDHDDIDGWGPEIYYQISYEGASHYEIYVHYFSDHGNGPVNVTLEIYDSQDQLVFHDYISMTDEQWEFGYAFYPMSHNREPLVVPISAPAGLPEKP